MSKTLCCFTTKKASEAYANAFEQWKSVETGVSFSVLFLNSLFGFGFFCFHTLIVGFFFPSLSLSFLARLCDLQLFVLFTARHSLANTTKFSSLRRTK